MGDALFHVDGSDLTGVRLLSLHIGIFLLRLFVFVPFSIASLFFLVFFIAPARYVETAYVLWSVSRERRRRAEDLEAARGGKQSTHSVSAGAASTMKQGKTGRATDEMNGNKGADADSHSIVDKNENPARGPNNQDHDDRKTDEDEDADADSHSKGDKNENPARGPKKRGHDDGCDDDNGGDGADDNGADDDGDDCDDCDVAAAHERWEERFVFRTTQFLGRALLLTMGIRVRPVGPWPNTRRCGPCVVAFNHASALDGPAISAALPFAHAFVAKAELLWYPLLNVALFALGFVFVHRKHRARAIRALQDAGRLLTSTHRSIIISPEGTRSRSGRLAAFKKGPFHLATRAAVPILPVAIHGAYQLWPPGCLYPRSGVVSIQCGPLIQTHSLLPDPSRPETREQIPTGPIDPALIRSRIAMTLWDTLRDMLGQKGDQDLHLRPKYEGPENEEARPIKPPSPSTQIKNHQPNGDPSSQIAVARLVGQEDDLPPLAPRPAFQENPSNQKQSRERNRIMSFAF
eukprot:TRINITY_DN900_c0_g3_i5.p1 TRINITY_DN900_c0_g3~~TRINITY_DN900_c0_g3_i5.p1  ORF type:complete len:519 (-),score=113.71 TRINITY_DN900_c0_g3_i5:378-1934(-)